MNDYLMHYGVKGMKWGVRRTPAQLGHKPASLGSTVRKTMSAIGGKIEKSISSDKTKQPAKKNVKTMTDEELRNALSRLRMEEEYTNLMSRQSERSMSSAKSFVKKHASAMAHQMAERATMKLVNKIFEEKKKKFNVSDIDFKDTSKLSSEDLKDAVKWFSNEKAYQNLRKEYKERDKD